jgi:hypothetical protein
LVNARFQPVRQAFQAQQAVDGGGVQGREVLAARIGPQVVGCAGNVRWSGRDQSDQLVLVHGQLVFSPIVPAKVGTEPVRETGVDRLDCLAETTA